MKWNMRNGDYANDVSGYDEDFDEDSQPVDEDEEE